MNIHNIDESTFKFIKQDIPDVKEEDILSLIADLIEISDKAKKEQSFNPNSSLNDWMPNRHTIKELMDARVPHFVLEKCIREFISFATEKGYKDNLDSKFITHVKIMVQNGKFQLNPDRY